MRAKTIDIPSVEERRSALAARYSQWIRETIDTHFEKACKTFKEEPYISVGQEFTTYGEVWTNAQTFAKALLGMGLKPREHVAVLMENHPDYVSLYIAVSMVGGVFIPVNTMLRKEELAYVLSQSDTRFLVIHQKIKRIDYQAEILNVLNDKDFQAKAKLEKVICIPTEEGLNTDELMVWKDFLAKAEGITAEELGAVRKTSHYPEEINTIMYTSGSTGQSKGVMLTHDMLLRSTYATCLSRAIEKGRVTFAALPFYHCFNIIEGFLAMSFVGGALVAPPLFQPKSALQLMEKFKANDFLCVPSMFVPLLNQPDIESYDLTHLYAVWCGAAPAPVTVWQRSFELLGLKEICTGYGQTEVASSGVITEMGDSVALITQRVGRPKLGGVAGLPEYGNSVVQYRTIDSETGAFLPKGEIGDLVVRGVTVTRGYYKKPIETQEIIDKDGWLKTGDVGRLDENGYIELLGRSKELYKVSGELVAPKEIESVIDKHPAVAQASVVGVPDRITTEAGAAFIELKAGQTLKAHEIQQLCAEKLARFKVPRYVWFINADEWPMTSTGKIQKVKLKGLAMEKLK